jgi:hypothetical protein
VARKYVRRMGLASFARVEKCGAPVYFVSGLGTMFGAHGFL